MKSHVLTLVLSKPLQTRLDQGISKKELAAAIGVSPQKLTRMIESKWEYMTRDGIERAADYLGLDVSGVFHFVPVDFWKPIEQAKSCTFLRGRQRSENENEAFVVPFYDDKASRLVKDFLGESLTGVRDPEVEYYDLGNPSKINAEKRDRLMEQVTKTNYIVVGGPRTNAAAEILISKFFKAEPFHPEHRTKIPFGFCWLDSDSITDKSTLGCSSSARDEHGNEPGIAFEHGHVSANFLPADDYLAWDTNTGHDCGLIFVTNSFFGKNHDAKLIFLAGFSGVGTVGAAAALIRDFRYLEPINGEKHVYGIVDVTYSKRANTRMKKFREFHWRYREGGHSPLAFKSPRPATYKVGANALRAHD